MDEVKLALELNRVVHNECKDVPHDIGLRLLDVVKKHLGEQLNLPPVIKSVCLDCKGEPTTINTVRYFFCEKCKKVGQTVL